VPNLIFFLYFILSLVLKQKKSLCAVPVQMEDENNSNSVDPTFAVATGTGNTTEDKTARSSLTILLRGLLDHVDSGPTNVFSG
jgi:hypothetical protein